MTKYSNRILLHIGPHKTGSTYIQKTLYDGRLELEKSSVLYPDLGVGPQWGHHQVVKKIEELELDVLRDYFSGILNFDGLVIFSSENFDRLSENGISKLAAIFSGFEVNVVYFVRRASDLLYANWQEAVKHGGVQTFFEYTLPHVARPFRSRLINHLLVLDKYADRFGHDSIILIDYDWAKSQGGIFETFCNVSSLPQIKVIDNREVINKSLLPGDVEIIRGLNLVGRNAGHLRGANIRAGYLRAKKNAEVMDVVGSLRALIEEACISVDLENAYFENAVLTPVKKKYRFSTPQLDQKGDGEKFIPQSGWMLNTNAVKHLEFIYGSLQTDLLNTLSE